MIEVRWHGRGGQGSFTASKLLGASSSLYGGKFALAFPSFGPERRGAPVLAFTKIDDKKIIDRSEVKLCDYIVILDNTLFEEGFINNLKENGRIIINTSDAVKYQNYDKEKVIALDATSIALEFLGKPITNTAMLGALAGISKIVELDWILKGMENFLSGAVLTKNIEVVRRTYNLSKEALV